MENFSSLAQKQSAWFTSRKSGWQNSQELPKKDKTMSKRKKDEVIRETKEYKQQMIIGKKVLDDYPVTLKKLSE